MRKHDWLWEAYLEERAKDTQKQPLLRSFPDTRYGYAHLMVGSVVLNFHVLLRVFGRPEFSVFIKKTSKKDGTRDRWHKALDSFEHSGK